ncbi:MAG: hypothetical protein R3F11_17065 [Verrucomicrobiales bacterium]
MKVLIDYPTAEDEGEIVSRASAAAGGRGLDPAAVSQVCSAEDILQAQRDAAAIRAVDDVAGYAVNITRRDPRKPVDQPRGRHPRSHRPHPRRQSLRRHQRPHLHHARRRQIRRPPRPPPPRRHRPELAISYQTVDDTLRHPPHRRGAARLIFLAKKRIAPGRRPDAR